MTAPDAMVEVPASAKNQQLTNSYENWIGNA